jgi:uncharacterized Zn-binding protein involved in type VI secretion
MASAAAKMGDLIRATEIHQVRTGGNPPIVSRTFAFEGKLSDGLSGNVNIMGQPAATSGSTARHKFVLAAGETFVAEPSDKKVIVPRTSTVFINGKTAGRHDDPANPVGEPVEPAPGTVVVENPCTVFIGD